MASLNLVQIIGNIGKDPEIRHTASGTAVASLTVATSERFKSKAGDWEEKVEWHTVILWNKLAEIARDHLHKGRTIYIQGRLQTRKWQDKSGNDRYTTEIVGDKLQMLSPKKNGDSQQSDTGTTYEGEPGGWDNGDIPF